MRALFFACLRAVIKFPKKSTVQGLKSIIICTFFASFAAQNCYLIIDHVNNASGSRSVWRQLGVTKSTFCLLVCLFFRLQNSPYFCVFKYARAVKRGWKQRARLVRLARFVRVRLLRHALPISLLILRKKTDCFAVYLFFCRIHWICRSHEERLRTLCGC